MAMEILQNQTVSVILSDQRMPEMDGVTFLKQAMKIQPEAIRIMITGYADIEASINAVNDAKIFQYISKPFEPEDLKIVVKNAMDKYNLTIRNNELQKKLYQQNMLLEKENKELKTQVSDQLDLGNFIGHSPGMQKIFKLVKKVMHTPTTVLLLGETGTGKEMLAKMIHFNSNRKDNLFIAQNCGAIPDTLLQSELFGHVKGAFTGALSEKKGLFEQADNGTVFLDEIGDTSPALQVGLLRVLQENEIKPLGSQKTIKVDVRVIAATNKDLKKNVELGSFREDLFYRLNVFPINIPPLTERREDIPELIHFFVKKYAQRISKAIKSVDSNVIKCLQQATFPGNVRELENEIERMVTMADENSAIDSDLLSERFLNGNTIVEETFNFTKLKPAIDHLEKKFIMKALTDTNGNILKSAEMLGISRVGLHKMLKRHNIEATNYKS
jgi:two-component system, NtrC family, response regulator HupR/HoxA